MKLAISEEETNKTWDNSTGTFFWNMYGYTIREAPNGGFGFISLSMHCVNSPDNRHNLAKFLGIDVYPAHEIAHRLILPDERPCKPNWFDDNVIVVADKQHKIAVVYDPLQWSQRDCTYPSQYARPNSKNEFIVRPPDIKKGNKMIKHFAPLIGEARLRMGVLGITAYSPGSFQEQMENKILEGFVDMSNVDFLRTITSSHFPLAVREWARETVRAKELVYEC